MMSSGGRRKLHYQYTDSTELVEELDVNTNEVLGNIDCMLLFMFVSEEMEAIKGVRGTILGVRDR